MIRIQKATSNEVFLTLTELSTLDSPVYLFLFINDQTGDEYTFIANDVSVYEDRYNKFVIVETDNPNNLDGEVYLPLAGFYSYQVFEQVSTTNLIPPNSEPVEKGKVIVVGAAETTYIHDNTSDNIVYNP